MSAQSPIGRVVGWVAVATVALIAVSSSTSTPAVEGQVAGVTIERSTAVGTQMSAAASNPAVVISDPGGVGDVGMPIQYIDGRISGYDLAGLAVTYDDATDVLTVTFDGPGVVGDADGDGDPSTTGPILAGLGGVDEVEFGGGEHFSLLIDVDQDGAFDAIAGVASGSSLSGYNVAAHTGGPFSFFPSFGGAYGVSLPQHNSGAPSAPTPASPDLTVSIPRFSELAASLGLDDDSLDFNVNAHLGSSSSAGIGAEFVPTAGVGSEVRLDARIGDRVWIDSDFDGIQDPDEVGAQGVKVDLIDALGNVVATATTDIAGEYEFAARPGSYQVRFGLLPDHSFTHRGAGGVDDSDADLVTGFTSSFTVEQGDERLDLDAGLVRHDPSIDIEKSTNGEDADTAPGPELTPGSEATFTYVITNDGNLALVDVAVDDDVLGPVCTFAALAPGESRQCSATAVVQPGQYVNTGSVVATPTIHGRQLNRVSDSDVSHHFGAIRPSVDLQKSTNGADSDSGPGETLESGSTATFEYVVSNLGNVDLADVIVVDDVLGEICRIDRIVAGSKASCEAQATVVPGPYVNTGTVTAVPVFGALRFEPISDSDPSHHYGEVVPGIDIEKSTNGVDSDEAPGETLESGSIATFEYVVTNTGNVDLIDVSVTDDRIGPVCTIGRLGPGATETCTTNIVVAPGPYVNQGFAVGTPEVGSTTLDTVSDTDLSHHFGSLEPAVDIEKSTNGEDADTGPGPSIYVGDQVTWLYRVTNSGNVTLTDIAVTDDVEGLVCTIATLGVGDTEGCVLTATAIEGAYANVGSVTAVPLVAGTSLLPVSDADPSHYTGIDRPPACTPDIVGPLMWAGKIDRWDSGLDAQAGSFIRIITNEPDSSPGQPHEQVYVQVGDALYGPTPVGLGELSFTVESPGRVVILHYSVVTGDTSNPNSVAFSFCGTDLT